MSVEFETSGGGRIIVNDNSKAKRVAQVLYDYNEKCMQFHQKLLSIGVKAYRSNDGWVDRDKHIITFLDNDETQGYYYGNMNLKEGDKIFIGNAYDGGQFAIIDKVIDIGFLGAKYHYNLIDEYLKQ